jgi:hypothetical protein
MGWNIGLGILFIFGGLSGDFVLYGTNSSGWLAIVGTALLAFGLWQLSRQRQL